MKHNNSKFYMLVELLVLIPNMVVAGDYLISKKEFKINVNSIKVFPVVDSLRQSCLKEIENVQNNIIINPSDTAGNENIAKLLELSKASAMAPYYIAFKTLKLDNSKARDTVLLTLNMKILEILIKAGNYKITTAGNVNDTINNIDSSVVMLKSYLKIIPKTVDRNRGGRRSQINTSAIVLDAWVNSNVGTPLWHKHEELYYYMVEESMAKIFTNKAIEELIQETYKSLIK